MTLSGGPKKPSGFVSNVLVTVADYNGFVELFEA